MADLRRDPIVGRWVIVQDEKESLKPQDYTEEEHKVRQAAVCQFCQHKEDETPSEVDSIRPDNSEPNSPGWFSRVVPNKFPALKIEGNLDKRGLGIYDMSNGIGAHEVVIEGPDHNKTNLADFTPQEIVNVIKLYQNRALSLAKDKRFKYIMIFKNYGESSGASVEHAHSQIIALPMIPKYVLEELEGSRSYHDFHDRCIYCDIMQQEYDDKERIVVENDSFLAFCPYVPRFPFETWILPKEHNDMFCSLTEDQRYQLACVIKDTLTSIKKTLSDPSYNFHLHVTPIGYEHPESFHWHIEIVPQIISEAGFEWGTEFYVIRTSPDVAAKYMRKSISKTK